jgi:hypothetical protein
MFTTKLKKVSTSPIPRASQPSSPQLSPSKNAASTAAIVSAPLYSAKSADRAVVIAPQRTHSQAPASLRPQSPVEQYWAARAIKAETLLSARMAHHRELRSLSLSEETKRSVRITSRRAGIQSDGLWFSSTSFSAKLLPLHWHTRRDKLDWRSSWSVSVRVFKLHC